MNLCNRHVWISVTCAFEQASGLETWRHTNAIVVIIIIIIIIFINI